MRISEEGTLYPRRKRRGEEGEDELAFTLITLKMLYYLHFCHYFSLIHAHKKFDMGFNSVSRFYYRNHFCRLKSDNLGETVGQ